MSAVKEQQLLAGRGQSRVTRTSFDTLDDSQVEVFAGRLLLSVDLLRDRAGYIVFNDRHYLQFQEIGPLGINLRERGLGTFDEVETSS